MKKNINWAAIIILSLSASSTMTLAEYFDMTEEKTSAIQSQKPALIAGILADKNTDSDEKPEHIKATPLARALAQSANQQSTDSVNVDKTLTLEISELRDNSGLVYLGGRVSAAELSRYLEQLKNELGEEQYAIYRQYQAARDHQTFHVTLINPYEYQMINKKTLRLPPHFRVTLHGLGRVENDEKKSYFVVASSSDGQFIRQNSLLKNKDFHVTLGFFPDDIYGVSKGRDTLIKK